MRGRATGAFVSVLVVFCAAGCGHKSVPQPPKAAQKSAVLLPDWAPKNPSPEFLRAATVLKSLTPEVMGRHRDDPTLAAGWKRWSGTFLVSWEMFGALMTDQQIAHLRRGGEEKVPIKSFTAKQRAMLDDYFAGYRASMKGEGEEGWPDMLVELYREGAKKDLSNVAVGFVSDGHGVNMQWWITQSDGSVTTPSSTVALL